MKRIAVVACLLAVWSFTACSLPPEKPVTKDELYRSGLYSNFSIKESPESVLAALNREGEVVLEATYKGKEYYLKVLATSQGLKMHVLEK